MKQINLHEIRICLNPGCGFRFPVSPTEQRITNCPKCGGLTELAEAPYASFCVPEKASHHNHPPLVAVLDNIRSTFNVGAMFRTSDGAGVSKLYLCGITPTPENPKIMKTALGAERSVPWEHHWDVLETVISLKNQGFEMWALEGGSSSKELFSEVKNFRGKAPIALVVGNEISGVDPEVIRICDHCVYIPMEGIKESLNVSIAFGISIYQLRYRNCCDPAY